MGMKSLLQNAAITAFKVAGDLVITADYVAIVDDGFGNSTETLYPIQYIPAELTEEEISVLSFKTMIQPKDAIVLIPGKDLPVDIATGNQIRTSDKSYEVQASDTDSAKALYTVLLRE